MVKHILDLHFQISLINGYVRHAYFIIKYLLKRTMCSRSFVIYGGKMEDTLSYQELLDIFELCFSYDCNYCCNEYNLECEKRKKLDLAEDMITAILTDFRDMEE